MSDGNGTAAEQSGGAVDGVSIRQLQRERDELRRELEKVRGMLAQFEREHNPGIELVARGICSVTLNGMIYNVLITEDPSVGGICEIADDVLPGERPKIIVNHKDPELNECILHELLHGWFRNRLAEQEVDLLAHELMKAGAEINAAIEEARKRMEQETAGAVGAGGGGGGGAAQAT